MNLVMDTCEDKIIKNFTQLKNNSEILNTSALTIALSMVNAAMGPVSAKKGLLRTIVLLRSTKNQFCTGTLVYLFLVSHSRINQYSTMCRTKTSS